jgi:hypothetical protein
MTPGGSDGSDLIITIGGDISPLEEALASIPQEFAGLTTEINDTFAGLADPINETAAAMESLSGPLQEAASASADASQGIINLAAAAASAEAPVAALAEQLDLFATVPLSTLPEAGEQLQMFATYAGEASTATADLAEQTKDISAPVEEANNNYLSLIGTLYLVRMAVQAVIDVLTDLVQAYGNLQNVQIAVESKLGDEADANQFIDNIQAEADVLGILTTSADTAAQRLLALGLAAGQIPVYLEAIADGAAAMNTSFDTAQQRFDQIINSTSLMPRALTALGLTIDDMAVAMGKAGASAADLNAIWKNSSEAAKAAALAAAELATNSGEAQARAKDVLGAWNEVQNAMHEALQLIGEQLGGFQELANGAVYAIKFLATLTLASILSMQLAWDALVATFKHILPILADIGAAMTNFASGNWSGMVADLAMASVQINNVWDDFAKTFTDNVKTAITSINKLWSDGANQLPALLRPPLGEATDALVKWNEKWQDLAANALNTVDEAAEGTADWGEATKLVSQAMNQAAANADKMDAASMTMFNMLKQAADQTEAAMAKLAEQAYIQGLEEQLVNLMGTADQLASKVPADFAAMQAAIGQGFNVNQLEQQLQKVITDANKDILAGANNMSAAAQQAAQNVITVAQAALTDLKDMQGALAIIGDTKAFDTLSTQMGEFAGAANNGLLSAQQMQIGIDNIASTILTKFVPQVEAGKLSLSDLQAMLAKVANLMPEVAAAAQQGLPQLIAALQQVGNQATITAGDVDTAWKALGATSLAQAAAAVNASGAEIIAVLQKVADASQLTSQQFTADQDAVLAWANKVLPMMVNFGAVISDDVLAQIAKISPALADAAREGPSAFADAVSKLQTTVTNAVMTTAAAYKELGLTSQVTFQNILAAETQAYERAVAINAPIQDQLAGLSKIYQTQLQIATATGASADATLQWTEKLSAVQIEQNAIKNQTLALSNLYTDLVKTLGTMWTQLGTQLGDAIAGAQSFGAAFKNVITDVEKALGELVANYMLGQLKNAFLTDTDAVNVFQKAFNVVFGDTGDVAKSLTQTTQNFMHWDDETQAYLQSTTSAVQNFQQTTTSAMKSTASSISSSASSMVSSLSLVAMAVAAIAGIIGDFELSHIATTLGHIEDNTRIAEIILVQDQPYVLQTAGYLALIHGDVVTSMGYLQTMAAQSVQQTEYLGLIALTGGGGGGGGGGGTNAALASAVMQLEETIGAMKNTQNNLSNAVGTLLNGTTQVITSTQDLANTTSNLSVTTADLSNTVVALGNTVTSASTGVAAIATAVAKAALPVIGPGQGVGAVTIQAPNVTLPNIGPGQGVGGLNSALETGMYTSHPINLNVNLSGSVLTGANGMQQLQQQLSSAMVNQLARMGIRMTRG